MKKIWVVLASALLSASGSRTFAQQMLAQPAQNEGPQRTTATYSDWIVQCETAAQSPHQKSCEMAQGTQIQGKNLPFSRVALAHPLKGQSIKLVVQVPVNASFSTNVRIQTNDADPGIATPFTESLIYHADTKPRRRSLK